MNKFTQELGDIMVGTDLNFMKIRIVSSFFALVVGTIIIGVVLSPVARLGVLYFDIAVF